MTTIVPVRNPRRLTVVLCLATMGWGAGNLLAQYSPPDQRTSYDSWMRDIRDRRPSASSPVPQTDQAAKFRERQAESRFQAERMRLIDESNARLARENARNVALQADYDRLANLGQQALAGSVTAMRLYGFELMNRADSNERTRETGRAWIMAASDHGDPESRAWIHEQAAEVERRRAAAEKRAADAALAKTIREAIVEAQAGNVLTMRWLGVHYYFEGTPEQKKMSDYWRQQAIEHNDIATLEFLIDRTRWGTGTPEELAEGLALRLQLAGLPHQPAMCYEVGEIYLTGKFGVTVDRAKAAPYFEKAAAGGKLEAWFRLAEATAQGLGGPPDPAEAIRCYRAALAQALPESFAQRKSAALLVLSTLMLEPAANPSAHAAELLALWDQGVLEATDEATALCRLASDALASGRLGVSDPGRELFYFSRALVYGTDWEDTQDRADRAEAFVTSVLERMADQEHPQYVIERKSRRMVQSGMEGDYPYYAKVVARPANLLLPAAFAARQVPKPVVRAYLLAGAVANKVPAKKLEELGWPLNVAFVLYDEAATKFDDPKAWLESGRLLLEGRGVTRDAAKAQVRLQTAWDKGEAHAAWLLAGIQERGLVADASPARGHEWIERGAAKEDPECMQRLGREMVSAAREKNVGAEIAATKSAQGILWLKKAAAGGSPAAMMDLSDVYDDGLSIPRDEAVALDWLNQAVALDFAPAQRRLAERLAVGRGVAQDKPRALKLLYAAAHQDLQAANNLGVILWRGDWGEKDVADGLKWMEVTLEHGFWVSGRNLAKIHHLGLDVPADEAKARAYLEQAGAAAGTESAAGVADLYERGEVITRDPDAAQRWRDKAASYPPQHG